MKRVLLLLVVLLTASNFLASAQSITVTGRVLDETNQGLPGAGVSVKNSAGTGTATDAQGNFTISVPAGTMLVIQAIGYRSQDVAAAATITVKLQTAAKELNGAIVTALAIKREKRELGYDATTLSSDDVNEGNNVSALSSIQGKTAGVNVTSTTGGPGGSTRVVLRGEKSINSNNALIVVDGIPVNNDNRLAGRDARYQIDFGNRGNDVNPEDVESITVLKGPAAAALYGSEGANGAIIITTKSGKNGKKNKKATISYSSSYTLSDILKLPTYQNKYGQGDLDNVPDDRRENFSWGYAFDNKVRPWGQEINGQQQVKPYSAQPDNVKDFFNLGTTWENNASLAGATDKSSFFLSLNTLNNKGVIPFNFYDKYSIRLNVSADISKKVYSNFNINYLNEYSRVETSGQGTESVMNNVFQQPRDIPIPDLRNLNNIFNSMGMVDSNGINRYGYYGAYTANPYYLAENVDNRDRTDRIIGSGVIGVRPNAHWDIYNRIGVDFVSDRVTAKIPTFSLSPYDEAFYSSAAGLQMQTDNGGFFESSSTNLFFNNDLIANYNKDLSDDISFNGLVGANLSYRRQTILSGNIDDQTNNLVIPGYYNLNNNFGPIDVVDQIFNTRKVSLYTDLRLGFKKALFLELTGRNDWTSTLDPGNRSFFYPSANASWVFTESFKDKISSSILSYGKLRGGYASVGNGATAYENNEAAFARTTSATGFGSVKFPFNGTPGFTYQNSIGNPDLRPERTNSYEVGVDLALFHNRVSIEATYYNALSVDQIIPVPVPASTGFTSRIINLGDIRNKGIELSGRVTPISTKSGFRWELYGTFSKNDNNVERLANGVNQISFGGISGMAVTATVGQPFGAFYGTDVATDSLGRTIVNATTGLPTIGANTIYKGTYQPKYTASWGTNLSYKGFKFNILFFTKQGGVFYSHTKSTLDFTGTSAETEKRDDYVWPNSVYVDPVTGKYVANTTVTFHPYDWYTAGKQNAAGQDIVDATYVKLQEVGLDYSLPDNWLKRTFLGHASVGIFGNNLVIWTPSSNKYSDPEMTAGGSGNLQGFDYTSRPSLRNYGIRLSVTF